MPTPRDFMERVVAWPASDEDAGYVNLHFSNAKISMTGRPFRALADFMGYAQWGTLKPSIMENIYFCVSTQAVTGRKTTNGKIIAARHANTALKLKSIWLDIDVKPEKGYSSQGEALSAIQVVVKSATLPPPSAVVVSGGGIHVYWISDKPLSVADWTPYAHGLRAEAERCGLKFDQGVTTDPARLMRVPGTYNYKYSPAKVCRLVGLGESYDFAAQLSHIAKIGASRVTAPVTRIGASPFDLSGFDQPSALFAALKPQEDSLADGIYDDSPLVPDLIFRNCPHFQDAARTHGAGYSQGLWMLDMLACTSFDDGRRWAHYFSKGYATYDAAETDKMFDRKSEEKAEKNLGWPSCQAFEKEGCQQCKGCPFYHSDLRSPLNLAKRLQPVRSLPAPTQISNSIDDEPVDLPQGYVLNQHGIICEIVQEEFENGVVQDKHIPLFMSRVRGFSIMNGEPATLTFEVELDKGNWKKTHITEDDLATEAQLMRAIRNRGVKPNPIHKRRIEQFMTSFMAKLDAAKRRQTAVPYGWIYEGATPVGFCYGGQLIKGEHSSPAGMADAKMAGDFSPTGTIEPWFEALKIITDQKYPALEAIVALSFAAPLMYATGLYNAVMCAWSDESGAHKSTSIAVGLAVWANPQMGKENSKTSPKAILKKLGELKNLPIYWDEINRAQRMKAVQEFLDVATEGRAGLYLNQDRSFRDVSQWQSLVGVGANVSLCEFIRKHTKSTDAQLQRIFEIKVDKRPDSTNPLYVARLIESLNHNYGHVGLTYAYLLAHEPQQIDTYVKEICQKFNDDVQMKSEERYRAAIAGTMYAGAMLANQIGATFNTDLLYDYLKAEFLKQRKTIASYAQVAGTYLNTSDTLSRFLSSVTRNVIWVDHLPPVQGRPTPVLIIAGPLRDDPVFVRCAVADRVVQLDKAEFEKFLRTEEISIATTMSGLQRHFGAMIDGRANLTAGTNRVGGRGPIISIPAKDGMLYELCFKQSPVDERPDLADDPNDPSNVKMTDNDMTDDAMQSAMKQALADRGTVDQAFEIPGATGIAA